MSTNRQPNRYNRRNSFIPAADLGLPTEPRPAKITRIEQPPEPVAKHDWSKSDQPYRAQRGEHMDIAKGFRHVALPVSASASLALPFSIWVGFGVPIFSLLTLAIMTVTFTLSYFACWILSQFFSHYGVELARVLLGYRLLRHDQRERHRHYRRLSK